jgi:hypothetical protein
VQTVLRVSLTVTTRARRRKKDADLVGALKRQIVDMEKAAATSVQGFEGEQRHTGLFRAVSSTLDALRDDPDGVNAASASVVSACLLDLLTAFCCVRFRRWRASSSRKPPCSRKADGSRARRSRRCGAQTRR